MFNWNYSAYNVYYRVTRIYSTYPAEYQFVTDIICKLQQGHFVLVDKIVCHFAAASPCQKINRAFYPLNGLYVSFLSDGELHTSKRLCASLVEAYLRMAKQLKVMPKPLYWLIYGYSIRYLILNSKPIELFCLMDAIRDNNILTLHAPFHRLPGVRSEGTLPS